MAQSNVPSAQRVKAQKFSDMLTKSMDKLVLVASKQIDPGKVVQIFAAAANRNPNIYNCTPASIIQTAMTASELGLTVGGSLGHLYPVPYGKECVPIIGYRGLIKLALRSGNIATIEARNVYEHDHFVIDYSKTPPFEHRPIQMSADRGEYKGSYCVSRTKEGFIQFTWMDCDEIWTIKARSKAKNSGPWKTDEGEMCRKTVTRRHVKYLDLTVEAAESIGMAEAAEVGEIIKDITPPKNAQDELRDDLGLNEDEPTEDAEVVDTEPATEPETDADGQPVFDFDDSDLV